MQNEERGTAAGPLALPRDQPLCPALSQVKAGKAPVACDCRATGLELPRLHHMHLLNKVPLPAPPPRKPGTQHVRRLSCLGLGFDGAFNAERGHTQAFTVEKKRSLRELGPLSSFQLQVCWHDREDGTCEREFKDSLFAICSGKSRLPKLGS